MNEPLWDDDLIQFARLLCEVRATHEIDNEGICVSMDLPDERVEELFARAQRVWDKAKKEHCR